MSINRKLLLFLGAVLLVLQQISFVHANTSSVSSLIQAVLDANVPKEFHSKIQYEFYKLRNKINQPGKSCNVALCSSMEATNNILYSRFKLQKTIVALLAATIAADKSATFSAVQHGNVTLPVSEATYDINAFVSAVNALKTNDDKLSNLGAGLGYCGSQVIQFPEKKKVIVSLGSGKSTIGFDSKTVAEAIKDPTVNVTIFGVPIGGTYQDFADEVGDGRKIIGLWNYDRIVVVMNELVEAICDL